MFSMRAFTEWWWWLEWNRDECRLGAFFLKEEKVKIILIHRDHYCSSWNDEIDSLINILLFIYGIVEGSFI